MKGKTLFWLLAGGVVIWFFFFRPATAAHEGFEKALTAAQGNGRLVLIDFTGSDWCGWCQKLQEEIFSRPEYQAYAQKNLETVVVDFPKTKSLSTTQKKQNQTLARQYRVKGFPTLILVDGNGKELARHDGYLEGGPPAFIAWVQTAR